MKAIALLAILSLSVLAGCSTPASKSPAMDPDGRYVIEMTSGNQFSPANAQVPVGATVVWENKGGAPHDVQAKDGSFSSGPVGGLSAGEEWAHQFDEAGTYVYECQVHAGSGMKGTLVVE